MLKYKRLIENMDVGQKLALIACDESGRDVKSIVPGFAVKKLGDFAERAEELNFLRLRAAANSWNPELFGKVSSELAFRLKRAGAVVAVTPDFGVKTNPYRLGMSEDPCLCGKLAKACANGILDAGSTPILMGCALGAIDTMYMDVHPDKRVLRDYVVKPFEMVVKDCSGAVIQNDFIRLRGEYGDVNGALISGILRRKDFGATLVCGKADAEFAAASISSSLCRLDGAVGALEAAHARFLRLKQATVDGRISAEELKSACADGSALSNETIDEAVDRFLDFAYACERHSSSASLRRENAAEICEKISEESIVLLKNNHGVLPLTRERRVAVIGRLAARPEGVAVPSFTETLSKAITDAPFVCTGYAEGGELSDVSDEKKIAEACDLARSSDIALVFLGLGREREEQIPVTRHLTLPTNQLALLSALADTGRRVVAVVIGDVPLDFSFAEQCSAVLLAPSGGSFGAKALLDILSGKRSPSGKLATSCVDGIDELLRDRKARKNFGRIKIGSFFGYRSPDIRESTRFVFGHGLSYTEFRYSELEASEGGVKFIVANSGACAGFETAQVYLGKKDSALARPERELAGFEKIYLEPGESRLVQIIFRQSDFEVLDRADEVRKTEGGEYTAYVGASYADIRLEGTFVFPGQTIMQRENLSDYVQSLSNIRSGGYVLKFADECRERFGRLRDWLTWGKRQNSKGKRGLEGRVFRENERILTYRPPLEKLFAAELEDIDEFDEIDMSAAETTANAHKLSLKEVAEQLSVFLCERGIGFEPAMAWRVLAAMSASRLIVARSTDSLSAERFITLLCEFFGAEVCLDDASGATCFDDLLYRSDENGKLSETALSNALSAVGKPKVVRIVGVSGVKTAFTAECTPFADFAENPEDLCEIAPSDQNLWDRTFIVPENLWIFMLLADGERADELPSAIVENAFVLELDLRAAAERAEKSAITQPSYEQMIQLCDESVRECAIGEDVWKKLDRFEDFVSSRASYQIGSKIWRRIERYVSVCIACGGTENAALDGIVAGKLLPSILPLLMDRTDSVSFCGMIETVLGEDYATSSLNFVRSSRLAEKHGKNGGIKK